MLSWSLLGRAKHSEYVCIQASEVPGTYTDTGSHRNHHHTAGTRGALLTSRQEIPGLRELASNSKDPKLMLSDSSANACPVLGGWGASF